MKIAQFQIFGWYTWLSVNSNCGLLAVVEGVVHRVVGVSQGHVGWTWDSLEDFSTKNKLLVKIEFEFEVEDPNILGS
jgi:hypothetical protein